MKNNLFLILFSAVFMIFIISSCKTQDDLNTNQTGTYVISDSSNYEDADSLPNENILKITEYDTPPIPIKNPMPDYPEQYKKSGIQGVVLLEVEIDENGIVDDIKVKKSLLSGPGALDSLAVSSVKNWIFRPATLKKRAVKAKVNIPIPFSLKSNR